MVINNAPALANRFTFIAIKCNCLKENRSLLSDVHKARFAITERLQLIEFISQRVRYCVFRIEVVKLAQTKKVFVVIL